MTAPILRQDRHPLQKLFCALALSIVAVSSAQAAPLVEPALHLKAEDGSSVGRVALTLDACGGQTDTRILSALVENRIPATIFVTGIWLKRNAAAVEIMRAHPDLFELENHGGHHIPAVDTPRKIYGIRSAGSPEAVQAEVESGAAALAGTGEPAPKWFRGATAEYSPSAIAMIRKLGFKVAGFRSTAMAARCSAQKKLPGASPPPRMAMSSSPTSTSRPTLPARASCKVCSR